MDTIVYAKAYCRQSFEFSIKELFLNYIYSVQVFFNSTVLVHRSLLWPKLQKIDVNYDEFQLDL